MSQYGALRLRAQHGAALPRRSSPTTTRARRSGRPTRTRRVRVLLQSTRASASLHRRDARRARASCRPGEDLLRAAPRRRRSQLLLRAAQAQAADLRSRAGSRWRGDLRGGAANGRVNGAYRGAMEFSAGTFAGVNAINALALDDYVRGVVARRVAAVVAARGAEGAGRRRAHLRDHDEPSRAPASTSYADTRSQVYGGVGGRDAASTDQAVAETRGAGRHLPGPARRHLLLLHLGRAHRERREHAARHEPRAVAEVGRRPYDDVSPRHRWGPIRMTLQAGRAQARRARAGHVPRHPGRAARRLAADRRAPTWSARAGRTRVDRRPRCAARFGLFDTWAYFTLDHERRGAAAGPAARRARRPAARSRSAPRPGCSRARWARWPGACCRCSRARR